jgi:DNA polymerase III delta prime subunit
VQQVHIYLTETYLETKKLDLFIVRYFFGLFGDKNFSFSKVLNQEREELEHLYQSKSQFINNVNFDSKKDFSSQLLGFYKNYPDPNLLFLGDLSQYSIQLQEGMLRLLEEPPKNLFIILYCQNLQDIIPTISSRARIHNLPKKIILESLDPEIHLQTKKKLPIPKETVSDLINKKNIAQIEAKNLEREEISTWLWQLESYLKEIYKQKPNPQIATALFKVLEAKKYNQSNLQKKFVLETLNL